MNVDTLLIVSGMIFLLIGLLGAFIPLIPGPPLSYGGFLLIHFSSSIQFSAGQLWFFGIFSLFVLVLDFILPVVITPKTRGSKSAMIGAGIGMLIGVFLFFPYGIIVGPVVGAWLAGKVKGMTDKEALHAAMGSFAGVLLGIVLKFTLSMFMLFIAAKQIIASFST
jgi:uncharacterized protein